MKSDQKVVFVKSDEIRGRGIGTVESVTVLSEFCQKSEKSDLFSNRASFLPDRVQNVHVNAPWNTSPDVTVWYTGP